MFELRPISAAAIPAALEKAEHYRLLHQPWVAESICLDILEADSGNQKALRVLLLARTDQFDDESARHTAQARQVLARLTSEYERAYYGGIICERRGKAELHRAAPGSSAVVYEWIREAMEHFDEASRLRPAGDDSAILRWNSCVRLLRDHPDVAPRDAERFEPVIGE